MNKETLEAFAREAAKGIKTEQDLHNYHQMLAKVTAERALNVKPNNHLDHAPSTNPNKRNSTSCKALRTKDGQIQLETPRDHRGSLEPNIIKKAKRDSPPWTIKFCFIYPRHDHSRDHKNFQRTPLLRHP